MSESWSEREPFAQTAGPRTDAGPNWSGSHRLLADRCAEMVPGAATIRVCEQAPGRAWPHPYARAYSAAGTRIALTRSQAVTIARWIMREHPEAAWDEPHDFDLRDARITRAVTASVPMASAPRGR